MTRFDKENLDSAIWQCITHLAERGYYTSREVRELVMQRHTATVAEFSQRLIAEAITVRVRRIMKSMLPMDRHQRPLFCPADLAHLQLPYAIALEAKEGDEEEAVYKWTILYEATFRELQRHINTLSRDIERDRRRLLDLQDLHDYLLPHVDERFEDNPIGPILEGIARAQEAEKRETVPA